MVNKYEMAKHFTRTITDTSFRFTRTEESIAKEAALDGFYVLRTNVPAEQLDTPGVVLAYKSLAHVERAFRHFKLSDLEVRPIYTLRILLQHLRCERQEAFPLQLLHHFLLRPFRS